MSCHRKISSYSPHPQWGVPVAVLNQAVHRNPGRFPPDFVFPLTASEWTTLRSQSVTSSSWGGRRMSKEGMDVAPWMELC